MTPGELVSESFSKYPPDARRLATSQLSLLQQMPLGFLPLLLREVITYDWKFPAERQELDHQFAFLTNLTPEQVRQQMAPFRDLNLPSEFQEEDWVNAPAQFSEKFSAMLWATHQVDGFRKASVEFVRQVNAAAPKEVPAIPRLSIVMIGRGVTENRYPLFRKLRPQGTHFRNLKPENGKEILFGAAALRGQSHPVPFGHWYVDGGEGEQIPGGLMCVSYRSLDKVRQLLVKKMRDTMQPGGGGPEMLRTMLAQMRPEDLGMSGTGQDGLLNRFQVSVLTEGSGTQLFSTTFVQWSARELLRRAQPLTLVLRYAPREKENSMRELLAGTLQKPVPDAAGSLIDADMGAYYTWINQQRLSGADQGSFVVWFEGHGEALAIGPAFPRGTEEAREGSLREIIGRISRA